MTATAPQTTTEGAEIVTVGRDGPNKATVGRFSFPIYCTKVYRAVRRPDGVLTWRLVGALGDGTSGRGVSGAMVARAEAHAAATDRAFVPGVTHNRVCR